MLLPLHILNILFHFSMPFTSFETLPPEIRNRIYRFCTPIFGYVEEYKGLLWASKRVKTEYETEAVGVMQHYLASIEKAWPHPEKVHIPRPTKISDLTAVCVQLPASLCYLLEFGRTPTDSSQEKTYRIKNTRLEICLAPLFHLRLSELKFAYYIDKRDEMIPDCEAIPLGLLFDLTSAFIYRSPQLGGSRGLDVVVDRPFRFLEPFYVRRLVYQWLRQTDVDTGWRIALSIAGVDNRNLQFFLNEEWRQYANSRTRVINWGRGTSSVYFDMEQ
jgi:hypothetical protein